MEMHTCHMLEKLSLVRCRILWKFYWHCYAEELVQHINVVFVNPGIAPPSLSACYTLFTFTTANCNEDSSGDNRVFVYTVCIYTEREREGG